MEIEDIKKLVELMVANGLSELDISDGDSKVSLRRHQGQVVMAPATVAPAPGATAPAAAGGVPEAQDGLIEITSPMVGTFYAAASPDSDPYVGPGTHVSPDSVVCIIEAMKVMNEIKAECSGAIVQVCVKNAQPVEYGQVLFRVKPA
jgi:acetyl-CoA carboxylase biotin carboxyl carrier protein